MTTKLLGAMCVATVLLAGPALASFDEDYDDLSGKPSGNGTGGGYYDEMGRLIKSLNSGGSGSSGSCGSGCLPVDHPRAQFAPGELPQGDAVQGVSLFEHSRGYGAETIPVVQGPPRYHWLYPPVPAYESVSDFLRALTD